MDFKARQRMKDFVSWARVVSRASNMKISRRHLADYVKKITLKSVPHVQHDYFSSFNQSNNWFVALLWSLLSSFLKLSIICCTGWLNAGFVGCQFTTYHRERCTVARDVLYVHHHHLISEVIGKCFCPFTGENTNKFTRPTSLILK